MRAFKDGWHLVAHPNGPAIAKCWDGNSEGGLLASLAHGHDDVPEKIRTLAIETFVEAAWPLLKPQFHEEAKGFQNSLALVKAAHAEREE